MSIQDKDERAAFEKWLSSLPQCIGYDGGCDGGLIGQEHEPNCPMFDKEEIDDFSVWQASRRAAFDRAIEIVLKEAAGHADPHKAREWYAERLTRERNGE